MVKKIDKAIIPITIPYTDKISVIRKLLQVYSVVVKKMTNRNIDFLTICILEDMKSRDFRDILMETLDGVDNNQQVSTEIYRLKDKELIYKHPTNNYYILSPHILAIKNLVMSNENVSFELNYKKE